MCFAQCWRCETLQALNVMLKMDMILFHCCQFEVVFTSVPPHYGCLAFTGRIEREQEIYGRMWREDGLCMAHIENRKSITPLRSAIRQNVFIRFTCKYTVT